MVLDTLLQGNGEGKSIRSSVERILELLRMYNYNILYYYMMRVTILKYYLNAN